MQSNNKVALVTGSGSGIGAATAILLAQKGINVGINYSNNESGATSTATICESNNVETLVVQADVSNQTACDSMVEQIIDKWGRLDYLVNNAGIISDNLIMRMKDEEFDKVIDTNLKGTYYCTKECIPSMVKQRWGRVINISSVVGIRGNIGQSNYSASKAGIHSFTKSVAKEVATRNITVNVIAPGYVSTATTNVLSEKVKKEVMSWIPMQRFGEPEEIAPIAAFLSREEARYITGEIIRVDGGMAI